MRNKNLKPSQTSNGFRAPQIHLFIIYTRAFRGKHLFSFLCAENNDSGYSLEPPQAQCGSKKYQQSMF